MNSRVMSVTEKNGLYEEKQVLEEDLEMIPKGIQEDAMKINVETVCTGGESRILIDTKQLGEEDEENREEDEENTLNWRTLPSALTLKKKPQRRLVVFLDYDGTLTPIVNDPSRAIISPTMRDAVKRLAARGPVAVVSGRAREKIHEFVALQDLYVAGSHGFDIDGPNGLRHHAVKGEDILPLLGRTSETLHEKLRGIDGVSIEDNRFALSVHWRNVNGETERVQVEKIVDEVLASPPYEGNLRKSYGKCVYELRPKVDWNKGKAVVYLLELLRQAGLGHSNKHFSEKDQTLPHQTTLPSEIIPTTHDPNQTQQASDALLDNKHTDPTSKDAWYESILPVYIGDDTTDEDAFDALKPLGGICVLNVAKNDESQRPQNTKATHVLRGVHDVETFLNFLAED
eukprot:CAMPEP_0197297934 /NCGR_PEP_ID=MMETSP0890-20130614/42312_1 /TAXON_ID=44058 ORGANISM="Aureoumbra lagunensis, Strain CCMP1510" /NCGR_SAMPLE_ID=MMETSP0890 /ASSEMBLY_ACC=CAM_ASM_000533 /LENGTH=399 /DNA_ID=CAMNT_0042775347 /DNA_START=140 /DNA_END=1342 /DNA_ORIENTATION=-